MTQGQAGLHINIAKIAPRKTHGTRRLGNGHGRPQQAHIQHIVQLPQRSRRRPGNLGPQVAGDDVGPRRRVQVLPDPPRAINLGMVQPKDRVAGANVKVAAGVARDGEVAPTVHAQIAGGAVALEAVLEGGQIGGLCDEVGRVLVRGPAAAGLDRDVAAEAARVVRKQVAPLLGGGLGQGRHVGGGQRRGDGPQVDGPVGEGALFQTAAASAGGQAVVAVEQRVGAVVRDVDAVAAQAAGTAVEQRAAQRVKGRLAPVPVGLGVVVAALVAQGLLVVVQEEAVPGEEVGGAVDVVGLVHVHHDEVVEAGLGAGHGDGVVSGGEAHEALHGVGVLDAFLWGEGMPVCVG